MDGLPPLDKVPAGDGLHIRLEQAFVPASPSPGPGFNPGFFHGETPANDSASVNHCRPIGLIGAKMV